MTVSTKIELSGDFFRRNPGKTMRGNIRDMLDNLAAWMESEVKSEVAGHAGSMPASTGWTADHVLGRTHSVSGKRWGLWAVVSLNTAGMSAGQAIRTEAAAAGRHRSNHNGIARGIEERWHPFRRVKSGVYRARPVINADLTRGLD